MKNMKPRSQLEKRIDGSAVEYVGGKGIEISGNKINLKVAQAGAADYGETGKYLGGVYVGQGLKIDYDGRLYIPYPTKNTAGTISIGDGLMADDWKCSVKIGEGMRYNKLDGQSISPNLGDGFKIDPSEEEDDPDYGKVHLNLGKGLEFSAREYEKKKNLDGTDSEEDDPTRYTSEVQLKLGKGLSFGANGELISEGGGGKEYTAGENITISEDGTISAQVKEYKAGKNISISDDGTIDAEGGSADLAPGGGITIETDEGTGKQTISAAVGEGAEIRDGKICTVPNIANAVFVSEADAKYLLHNFSQVEYIAGNKIGYAGVGNQIIIQGYLAYTDALLKETATSSNSTSYAYPVGWEKTVSTYTEMSGLFRYSNSEYTKLYLEMIEMYPTYTVYQLKGVKSDGTTAVINSIYFNNYNAWTGFGLSIRWERIYPPGITLQSQTYENGAILGSVLVFYQATSNITARILSNFYFPFASLAEYQAAVGLTYEPITLTEVVDNPTVVSGKGVEK